MIEIKSLSGKVLYTASSATDVRMAAVEAARNGADLRGANLYGANLYGADLYGADLYGADLRGANLYGADLRGADLRGANLYGADLRGADLRGANLYGANLRGVNLRGANLYGAKEVPTLAAAQSLVPPEEGSFIGWKKALDGRIIRLKVPAKAKRSSATTRKCRVSQAKVLAIFNGDGSEAVEAFSQHDPSFRYAVGEVVVPDSFDDDRWNECAAGIHLYLTRAEAEAH